MRAASWSEEQKCRKKDAHTALLGLPTVLRSSAQRKTAVGSASEIQGT
jgi:hypothetical protein